MKKRILMLIVVIVLFAIGCMNKDDGRENTNLENNVTVQDGLMDYMVSVKEQSDIIKTSLENDALTQTDMNIKSQELYKLWDEALNYLWGKLTNSLPEEEFAKLKDKQRIWIAEKEKAIEEAGKEFEGGSIFSLVVNGEAAKITEERVYELYEYLKKLEK